MNYSPSPKSKIGSTSASQSSYNLRPGGSSKTRSKKKKMNQLTLSKRGQFRVVDEEGVDRTPKLLYDLSYQVLEEWQPTVLDYVDSEFTGSSSSQISLAKSFGGTGSASYVGRQQLTNSLQMSFTNIANVDSYRDQAKTFDADLDSEIKSEDRFSEGAPSAFRLRNLPSREFYPPHSKVPLIAKETSSFTLFSMTSIVESVTENEADDILEDNEYYTYITTGKGRYTRKLITSEQQTPTHITTSEWTLCSKNPTRNDSSWVTVWKLHDELSPILEEKKDHPTLPTEEQWAILAEDAKFFSRSIIVERILGSPTFRDVQLTYRRSIQLDPLGLDIQFTYSTLELWRYDSALCEKRPATVIAINPLFPDIIAVGHGKFYYPTEADKGFICLWSAKNPMHPERFYKFNSSVKCLDFASNRPNLLAAGFLNGTLLVLDVSSSEKKVVYEKNSVLCNSYEKIIFIKWWIYVDMFGKTEERLMVSTGDGRILQFRVRLGKIVPFEMMRIAKTEGRVKGIDCIRKCDTEEILMIRFPAARSVVRFPGDHQFYLVSADDGTVHKCSTNFFTQHVDCFLAHSGPVYALRFSPFCDKLFLTCGADGAVRLWAWNIFEPLVTLTIAPDAVEDAAWSPRNSTLIASISDCYLYLWDLRRKTHHPASTITHPENLKFCSLQYSKTGDNIILGDVVGVTYMMALHGMPFEEKFKEETLAASIEKELIVKPNLLKLLKKAGPPFAP